MIPSRTSLLPVLLFFTLACLVSGCASFNKPEQNAAAQAPPPPQHKWDTQGLEPNHLALAKDLVDKEFYDVAFVQLKKAMEEKGDNALVYDLAGVCARETGDYRASESYLKKAAAIDPGNASVRNNMGLLYAALQENQRAEQAFQKAVSLDPGRADYLNNLGYLKMTAKRYLEAEETFSKALVLKPGYEPALNNLIVSLGMQRRDAAAMDLLMKHYDVDTAWYNMACIYTLRKEYDKAKKLMRFVKTSKNSGQKTAFEIQALPPDTDPETGVTGMPGDVASTIYTKKYMPAIQK